MCKRFFENQKVDEIGIYSVSLQKILISLMFFNTLSLFVGFSSFLSVLVEMILLFVCFFGAVKRKHKPLRAYVCINITLMVFGIIFFLFALMAMPKNNGEDTVAPANNNDGQMMDVNQPSATPATPAQKRDGQMLDVQPTNSTKPMIDVQEPSSPNHAGLFVFVFFAIFVSIVVMVLKFASLVMALRLARMICFYNLQHLSHPISQYEAPQEPNYIPMQAPPMYQPMYVPVVINGQPNGQNQQFVFPNGYYVPAAYTPQDKTQA